MASEIRVNQLTNRAGLGTITFANGGVQFSGITTFANGEFYVGTGATIINPSTNEFNFHTGGSNRLTINNSGVSIPGALSYEDVKNVDSVGIVTVRSGGYLDVRTGGSINTNATGGSASGTLHKNTTSGEFAVVSGGTGGNNYLSFYTSASAAPTEKLRIASDGKIGIGTDNPTALLHLQGTGGNTQGLYFKNGPHDSVRQYFNNGNDNSKFVITYDGTGGAELTLHATGVLGLNESNGDDVLIGSGSIIGNARLTIGKSAAGFTTAIALHNTGGDGAKIISSRSLVLGADYDNNTGTDGSLIAFETNGTEKVRITSDGEVGIGSAAPTSVLDIVAADPVLTLRDTSLTVTNANATLRLAESDANGVIENYWDVVADPTAGNFGFTIKQNLGGTTNTRFAIQPSTGNIGIAQINPQHKLHVVGDIYASDDLIAGDEIRNKVPADFWASDNTFINLNDVGNITHMGGYQTTITSNGYRDTNTQWKSNAINSNTGAAQIVLHPTGKITFGTESNKSNGSNWVVDTKLTITADGELLLNASSASAYLDVLADTLSSTSGTEQELAVFRAAVGNSSQLRVKHVRLSAGSDWTTVATRIQRKIDSTNMGYIDFGTGGGGSGRDIQFGNGSGTIMMHLDNAGKVGIGTDAPDETLELFKASGTNLVKVSTQANSTVGLLIEKTGSTTQSWKIADGQTANGTLEIYDATESETRLAIDGSGRVIIGQHSHGGGGTLVVVGNSNTPNAYGCAAFAKIGANPTSGQTLAQLRFNAGSGGTNRAAEISVQADSNWNDGTSQESKMIFKVASSGGGNTAGNALMTLKGTGDVEINRGNLVIANDKGISFIEADDTATGESVSSSVLDDYEEGSWTPDLMDGNGSNVTWNNGSNCRYVKVGRMVYCYFNVTKAETGSKTGNMRFYNLPYVATNSTMQVTGTWWMDLSQASGEDAVGGAIYIVQNQRQCYFVYPTTEFQPIGSSYRYLQFAHWDNLRPMYGSFTYEAAA